MSKKNCKDVKYIKSGEPMEMINQFYILEHFKFVNLYKYEKDFCNNHISLKNMSFSLSEAKSLLNVLPKVIKDLETRIEEDKKNDEDHC